MGTVVLHIVFGFLRHRPLVHHTVIGWIGAAVVLAFILGIRFTMYRRWRSRRA